MFYKIALDLKGHLVELEGFFNTSEEVISYLGHWYNSYKDLNVYIMEYINKEDLNPVYGSPYKFNISIYYYCEDGVYHEEQYHELDQGLGIKEIGSTYLVNNDLLPLDLREDGELIESAIENWIDLFYKEPKPEKPIWLI